MRRDPGVREGDIGRRPRRINVYRAVGIAIGWMLVISLVLALALLIVTLWGALT